VDPGRVRACSSSSRAFAHAADAAAAEHSIADPLSALRWLAAAFG